MADIVHPTTLTLPPLNQTQKSGLAEALGPMVALANPLDYHTYIWGDIDKMCAAWTSMVDPAIELLIFIVDFPRRDRCKDDAWLCTIEAAKAVAATGAKVVMLSTLSENLSEDKSLELCANGIVPMHGIDTAIAAIEALYRAKAHDAPEIALPKPSKIQDLEEAEAKSALAKFGLNSPKSIRLDDINTIEAKIADLTFPLVLKGEGFAHKTEAGAVKLNLGSLSEMENAAKAMNCDAFLIEEMIGKGLVELLIGVVKDPVHGYVLTLGAGGTMAEIMGDTTSRLLPISKSEIDAMLNELKIRPILDGYRGKPAADREAVIDAVLSVQNFVLETHADEIEINPMIIGRDFAIAADALVKGDANDR